MLSGKTALITGASRGIGKGIAEVFAKNGCNIAFTFASSVEKARAFEAELSEKYGVTVKGYQSNAADFKQSETLAEQVISEFGKVDILINNAGITRDGLMLRMSEEQWDEVINTNLKSAFNLTNPSCVISLEIKQAVSLICQVWLGLLVMPDKQIIQPLKRE